MKKLLALLVTCCLLLSCFGFAAAEGSDIVLLFTNDVHCGVDDNLGYAGLAAYAKQLRAEGLQVMLVDAGDAVQGAAIGTLSNGEYLTDIMNEVGYGVAVPGNHEFDYGMDQFFALRAKANFPYVKTLRDFDFSFQPSLPRAAVEDLASLGFMERGGNVVLVGSPGVGKTHIAVALGVEAVRARKLTYFVDC